MNTLITNDRLDEIIRLALTAPPGIFAEVGVYKGGSLKLLADKFPERLILGFDTFTGLPQEQWNKDEVHRPGEFSESIEKVREFVNNPNVALFKGTFPSSARNNGFYNLTFSFVHIDVDFYESTASCLEWFIERMNEGGVIVLDDYGWPNCPGVQMALTRYRHEKTRADYQAYIQL